MHAKASRFVSLKNSRQTGRQTDRQTDRKKERKEGRKKESSDLFLFI